MADVTVYIPGPYGLEIVDVELLMSNLDEGQDLDEAISNAAFDSIDNPADSEAMTESFRKVRLLNQNHDAGAYWEEHRTMHTTQPPTKAG